MISEELKKSMRENYINEGYWEEKTFGQILDELAEKFGERVAITDGVIRITYSKLKSLADSGSRYFYNKGIRKGDNVIVQLPNSLVFFEVIFSLFKIGAVPIFALPAHRENEIMSFIKSTSPKGYVVCRNYLGFDYAQMARRCVSGIQCEIYFADVLEKEFTEDNYTKCATQTDIDPYGTAVLLVSGGTTGIPKLIPRTHSDYIYNAGVFSKKCLFSKDTVFLAAIPAAHNFTFANPGVIGTMLNGGKTVLSATGSPDEIFQLIEQERVNITSMVPSLLILCGEMAEWDSGDLSSLKTILVGGAPISEELFEKSEKALDCKIRQVYGTAEGLNCITDIDMPSRETAGCQGTPISPADIMMIVNEDGNFAETGNEGELVIKGPYTIFNYYNCPKADEASFRSDGFYRTGDRAFIDENGNLHVIGRTKEQINKCGEKIMPSEIEDILVSDDRVENAAVVGIPDKEIGNRIAAFIITNGKKITVEEIREYMKQKQVAPYKWPDEVINLDYFPMTAVGKVDKKELAEIFKSVTGSTRYVSLE